MQVMQADLPSSGSPSRYNVLHETDSPDVVFNDDTLSPVTILSASRNEKERRSLEVQTTGSLHVSKDVQMVVKRHVQTQTMDQQNTLIGVDYDRLATFLRRIVPDIFRALSEGHTMDPYDECNLQLSTELTSEINFESIIRVRTNAEVSGQIAEMKISDLSWSANDGILAISRSFIQHTSWCEHFAAIQFYRAERSGEFEVVPFRTLGTNSCVTSLSCHPNKPSIVAAGLFNGDVLIWDIGNADAVSPVQAGTHDDAISQVYWVSSKLVAGGDGTLLLLTSSKNGVMLLHRMGSTLAAVELYKRIEISGRILSSASNGPRNSDVGSEHLANNAESCVTCFDFSCQHPALFVVGTLCGRIYKCSLDRCYPVLDERADVANPVMDEYVSLGCRVTCVRCSPSSNLFITSGTSKEIRVYNLEETISLLSILADDTVAGLTWFSSWTRLGDCSVFAAYGAGRNVTFYDVSNGTAVPVQTKQTDVRSVTCLRVNSKGNALAVGDAQGNLEIWKMRVPN